MAPVNGVHNGNAFELPPSSMLATHVRQGNGVPHLNPTNFAQLLEESLGQDENGNPNLNDDVDVNRKLILVVSRLGLDPLLTSDVKNPFRPTRLTGTVLDQLKQCLAVLQLAIIKTRHVVFQSIDPDDNLSPKIPLYVFLFPKLLSLVGRVQEINITSAIFAVCDAAIEAGPQVVSGSRYILFTFLNHCLAGLVNTISSTSYSSLDSEVEIHEDSFLKGNTIHADDFNSLGDKFSVLKFGQVLVTSIHLAQFLARLPCSKTLRVQLKKQTLKLQIALDTRGDIPDDDIMIKADTLGLQLQQSHVELDRDRGQVDHPWPDSDRARKRVKLSPPYGTESATIPTQKEIANQLTKQLTGHGVSDLDGLSKTTGPRFKVMSEPDQIAALECLGRAACQMHMYSIANDVICSICDEGQTPLQSPLHSDQADELVRTLMSLKPIVQRRLHHRLSALNALSRIVCHASSAASLKLRGSSVGEWCFSSMKSSSRDLRLVAARVLRALVSAGGGRDTTLIHENRVICLEYLQALWAEGDPASQEAVIFALGQMAHVVGDDELNIILVRLVDYLGHRNAYIAGTVYSELQLLSQAKQTGAASVFRPFWRTLSVVIVKSFDKRPEIAERVSDLMGVPIGGLLQIIEEHALPYLVVNRDRKLIERIGASNSSPLAPFDLCMKQNNFPRIMSTLLSQGYPVPDEKITASLLAISDDFREQDFTGWVNYDSINVFCELLASVGDSSQGKASKTYQGMQVLAHSAHRRSTHGSAQRRSDSTVTFLENNALAIVTRFAGKLNDGSILETNSEKRRCLVALGEIVKLGKSRIGVALPHICACLRAAMVDRDLCNTSFLSWNTMMLNLGQDDIRELIGQTFAIVVKGWDMFDTRVQEQAYNLVAFLLQNHEALIRDIFESIPSLASIPLMAKFEAEIAALKKQKDGRHQITAFISRLRDENGTVIEKALEELVSVLREKHDFLQKSILREQPENFIGELTRSILNACAKFDSNQTLLILATECLGAIGCLDPSKIESVREKKTFTLISNFAKAEETTAFLMFFMEEVLVKEYVSTSNPREKGFLAWSMQELLRYCDISPDLATRGRAGTLNSKDRHWFELAESTRLVLTPFLTSRFFHGSRRQKVNITYPFFQPEMTFKHWLTEITLDLLSRAVNENVDMIFDICCRLVAHGQGTAISSFLLPYAALHLLLSGTAKDKLDLETELSWVLQQNLEPLDASKQDHVRQCSQMIFDLLDYMSQWLQEKRKLHTQAKLRAEKGMQEPSLELNLQQAELVSQVLVAVPPKVITQRAIECRSFSRALFHQEQYLNSRKDVSDIDYRRLQDIYAQIDEPDGIEGISAQIKLLDVQSEVMEHKKSGRWNTAQSWYELQLMDHPGDLEVQLNLMQCLKESGQHDVLIHHFDGISSKSEKPASSLLPFAVEAAWVTSRWDKLSEYLLEAPSGNFAVSLGKLMLVIKNEDMVPAAGHVEMMFKALSSELTSNSTSSIQSCHESLLRMHIVDDVRIMSQAEPRDRKVVLDNIDKRLAILGTYVADKQYLLGIHRAIMHLKSSVFTKDDIASSWLTSARLARKAQATNQAFNAVLRASSLGERSAAIEQAKLMWLEGHHRKAINTLDGAIESGALGSYRYRVDPEAVTVDSAPLEDRNDMIARAYVLKGKWLDQAGQTQSETIIQTFRKSTEQNRRWEKGWYNLGRHYNKILESEKLKPPGKESQTFLTGEVAKLVIDNFLRALATGNKYLFQTLPKVLTLWLELVGGSVQEHDSRSGNTKFHAHNAAQRKKIIDETNNSVKKYMDRIPAYALYTILPQLVARICHPDTTVNGILQSMIIKVLRTFPQQALWTVLATVKSSNKERAMRGLGLLKKSVDNAKKDLKTFSVAEMREFVSAGQKFSSELLRIADFEIQGRVANIKLSATMGFNHKIAPSKLVVPCEACLNPNIPSENDGGSKSFRAFAKEPVTISAFLDDAKVLPSLQKPRKLQLRGSDGRIYSVLAKPHDDLRKDQRLMEFDTMINRFLKRDINASKRRLYIRTYAVVPLNEECGLIEWVDGLKTMRDILLELYRHHGVTADYIAIREQLDQICTRSENKAQDFRDKVEARFPRVLRQWFVETFPDAPTWFNARLRYTRSCAVMSMVGHVLGLGDRHGENILFEEGNGGILHVDFNCLFDKGLTFEKPEMVPFRLTHNMIDAFGPYKVDGPYRRCCEITLSLLRSNEDGLMTILETFLHDPTTDFMTAGKKRKVAASYVAGEVPDTPERMLEGVRGKVRGMLAGESVPLSVGGYVEEMIKRATDGANLARMYIGWCAFF